MRIHLFPVAVPDIFVGGGAPSASAVRLGCPISSLPINRLRQLSTPAHAYALLNLPPAAQSNAAAATRSGRLLRHRRRSHRSPGKIGNANTEPHYFGSEVFLWHKLSNID